GGSTTFSVIATGTGLTYTWKKGNTVLSNAGKYSGVNTSTLNISSTSTAEEGQYSCTVASTCGNEAISTAAQLSIGTTPSITGKSADLKLCQGAVAKMFVTVAGGLVTYQWKKDGTALTDGGGILGSKARELFITSIKGGDAGNYTCDVSSGCGAAQVSGSIKLELTSELTLVPGIQIHQSCNDEKISLTAPVTGTVETYQWKRNGINLSNTPNLTGAKGATLVLTKVTVADEGTYTCEVLSACGNILLTDAIQLQVNPKPKLSLVAANCESFPVDWPEVVLDLNNVFGNYSIFSKGSTTPLAGLQSAQKNGTYIIVKSNGICADSVEWMNDCTITSIEKEQSFLTIAPNPTTGLFKVNFPGMHKYEMHDSRGVEVLTDEHSMENEMPVDASHLANGIYYFTLITTEGQRISKRILIQR
ncbi:MAG: hypothetical protein C0490_24365, partial [Marivirga sp.]|nr:hypothetical protein [Marivirga sp.]